MTTFLDHVRRAWDRLRDAVVERRFTDRLLLAVVAVILISAGSTIWLASTIFSDLPDIDSMRGIGQMAQATTVLDKDDRTASTIFQEQRIDVPLSSVSPHLIHALLAIEDQRFYEHSGVDVVRIAGAAMRNIRAGRRAQGGSTITQQLARQSLLSTDKTFRRKIKEAIVARRLEHEFTKDEILSLYLNKMYFGDGFYGVEAASLGFFGKHARDLDVPEAALIAGLVKSPSTYAPTISRERATARRAVVLAAMRGEKVIDEATYRSALKAPVHLTNALGHGESSGQYFVEEVRRQLVDRFGWERVYQGGLRVYTTLDPEMQKAAEVEVQRALVELEARQAKQRRKTDSADSARLQAALTAIDPLSGEVRAMVGGRDFAESSFNRATQAKRQPGSAFKPFVYAVALERGYTPATLIQNLSEPVGTVQGAWTPEDEHLDSDSITMRAALRTSSNRAAVRMLQEVGIPETVRYAERMGVGSVPSVPSLALGSGEVTLVSMTAAFGAFANRGTLYRPTLIRRVETTDGEVLFDGGSRPERVVSEATAFMMTSMLADVINAGTAWKARQAGFTLPAAGKTGTTNDYHDAWFVGYTPKLVTGVWVGYDQPKTIMRGGYAGDVAVPLWGRFMKTATRNDEPEWFKAPATITGVEVCRVSGKLPLDGCRDAVVVDKNGNLTRRSLVYTEYFVRGTEPIDSCDQHTAYVGAGTIVGTTGVPGDGATMMIQPPPSQQPGAPVTDAASVPAQPGAPPAVDGTVQAKRGFWSRIFGRGRPEPPPAPVQDPPPPPPPPSTSR